MIDGYDIEELNLKDIEPLNMVRRVRVFNEQLLPDISAKAMTKESIEAAYNEVLRLGFKFIQRLEREDTDMLNEINEVHKAMHKVVSEISAKFRELEKNEHITESLGLP